MAKLKTKKLAAKPAKKLTRTVSKKSTPPRVTAAETRSKTLKKKSSAEKKAAKIEIPRSPEALAAAIAIGPIKTHTGVDLTEKVKELVRLAQEQGYLTYNDINDALPDHVAIPH